MVLSSTRPQSNNMKPYAVFIVALLSILAPIKAAMITALVLVIADTVTGIIAARQRKEPLTSAEFRRAVSKLVIYQACMILGFLTETYLTGDMVPVSKICCAFVGITEIKSIIENLNSISGGSLLANLISKLNSSNVVK